MPVRKTPRLKTTASIDEVEMIVRAEHSDPHHVLGAHPVQGDGKPAIAVRAFLPDASEAWVVRTAAGDSQAMPMELVQPEGFFERVFPGESNIFPYRIRLKTPRGDHREFEDPYRFPPVLSDFDLHLMGEGTHYKK